jgi:hypothetical protein
MRDPWLIRQSETIAALSWRSRLHRTAVYAGLLWVAAIGGVLLLKYAFDLIDRPLLSVVAAISLLPLLIFACVTIGYWRADISKRLHDQKERPHEKA